MCSFVQQGPNEPNELFGARSLPTLDGGPAAAKKRRTELEPDISFDEDVFMQKIETAMANACRGFIMPGGTSSSASDMQSLRAEVKEDIARVQTQLTEVFQLKNISNAGGSGQTYS